jgi:ParB-like chromosome segregation protein Spo0J
MKYEVNMVATDSLKEYEMNPRDNKRSVEKVAESIKNYGWKVPIVVDEDMIILAGHTRLKAAKLLELSEIPVHIAKDLSEEQKKAFRIMDNKAQDFSEWDKNLLSKELQALSETDFDLELTGFKFDEIAKITSDLLDFEEPEEIITNSELEQLTDIQASNVRMINLFLNQESEPYFQEMVMSLRERWKKENITDAVFQAVEIAYSNENL